MTTAVTQLAMRIFTRGPSYPMRTWRKRMLSADYRRGCANLARAAPLEEADPAIVREGHALRERLLAAHERKHESTGYRVLMLRPSSITAEIWFGDLATCLRYAGIECRFVPFDTPAKDINAAFEEFSPDIFIATEAPEALNALDLPFVQRYKRDHGCLRMFIPVFHSKAPGGYSSRAEDAWRRRLRSDGLLADVHFSIFEPEFHERFCVDSAGPEIDYLAVPQACNPFTDYPVAAAKRYDYFMATSLTDERLAVSYSYLRPILARYRGLWAGPCWGFGTERIPPSQMPLHYAQTRIALSPLVGFVHRHGAEVTHRVYAAAACGAFQITMPTSITHRFFRPDELVQAATPDEYVKLFDHYVDRPLARNEVALAALRRVYGEHTCFHRVDKLVSHWNEWRRRGLF